MSIRYIHAAWLSSLRLSAFKLNQLADGIKGAVAKMKTAVVGTPRVAALRLSLIWLIFYFYYKLF